MSKYFKDCWARVQVNMYTQALVYEAGSWSPTRVGMYEVQFKKRSPGSGMVYRESTVSTNPAGLFPLAPNFITEHAGSLAELQYGFLALLCKCWHSKKAQVKHSTTLPVISKSKPMSHSQKQ